MRIRIISIPVHDQEKALNFYTEKLGFIKNLDIPLGEGNRWLTLVSAEEQDGPVREHRPRIFDPDRAVRGPAPGVRELFHRAGADGSPVHRPRSRCRRDVGRDHGPGVAGRRVSLDGRRATARRVPDARYRLLLPSSVGVGATTRPLVASNGLAGSLGAFPRP